MEIRNGRSGDASIPMGLAAVQASFARDLSCHLESEKWLRRNSSHQAMLAGVGDTLSLLDRAASCWWGCSGAGSPHAVEYLIGGAASNGAAAIGLTFRGYYDEAITSIRAVAERVNLLVLLALDHRSFKRWIAGDEQTRRTGFSAVKVRLALENLGHHIPFEKDYYAALSGRGVHPGAVPQVYNSEMRPTAGSKFQEVGLDVCLVELASAVAQFGILGIGILSHLPIQLREEIWEIPMQLAERTERHNGMRLVGLHDSLASAKTVGSERSEST